MNWRVMVVASLLHYLHGHSRLYVSAAIVVAVLCALYLLGFAVFASDLRAEVLPEGPLMGPFRWLSANNLG